MLTCIFDVLCWSSWQCFAQCMSTQKKKKQKEENKMMNNGEDTIVQWFPKHLITCITFHFGIEFMGLLWYYHFLSLRLEHHPEL